MRGLAIDHLMDTGSGFEAQGAFGDGLVGTGHHNVNFDPGLLRPYIDDNGRKAVIVNTGRTKIKKVQDKHGVVRNVRVPKRKKIFVKDLEQYGLESPVGNAAVLRKDEWIHMDQQIVRAARLILRAWADLAATNPVGGFNGMAKTTHEYESMNDPGEAQQDMDGLSDGRTDSPQFKLQSIPLPITHSDFWFSRRRIESSRSGGTPLDTTMAEAAGRRIAEYIEKQTIGTVTGMSFGPTSSSDTRYTGNSTIYGYTTLPTKINKTDLTTPTGSNPEAVKQDVIEMRETLYSYGYRGPFILYHSTAYDAFLDDDYFRTGSTSSVTTLRARIGEIGGITSIRRLDYLTSGYQMLLVQMTSDFAQAINAVDITTSMWESQGGMRRNFKVWCINVPLLKRPFNGISPMVHGTTS